MYSFIFPIPSILLKLVFVACF